MAHALPDWLSALSGFLGKVALEGAEINQSKRGADADNEKAREAAREMWLEVLGAKVSTEKDVAWWAQQVATRVETSWRETRRLHGLIAQFNNDSRQGSIEAIAFAAQDISRSLSRLVAVAVPTTLAGGGGIVLLALFVDKG